MKPEWNRKYTTIAVYVFLVIAAALCLAWLLYNFSAVRDVLRTVWGILSPVIVGFALAYLINPIMLFCHNKIVTPVFRKKKKPLRETTKRCIAVLLAYLFVLALVSLFISVVIPQLATSISSFISKFSGYLKEIDQLTEKLMTRFSRLNISKDLEAQITEILKSALNSIYDLMKNVLPYLLNMTGKITTGVIHAFIGVIISVYMLANKETMIAQLKKVLYAVLPEKTVNGLIDVGHRSNATFSGFINGKIIDSAIIGVLCYIGLSILKMPYALLISVIVGVTNVIPNFGPIIGAIPGALILLITEPKKVIVYLIFILVLQQFDGNILGPRILGETVGISAFWVMVAILLFGGLFGFIGMFIGVPVFAVLYQLVSDWVNKHLKKKQMPTDLQQYASDQHKLLK